MIPRFDIKWRNGQADRFLQLSNRLKISHVAVEFYIAIDKTRSVMNPGRFDTAAFQAALDAQRQALKLTWKQVAAQAKIRASTLTRMAQGRRPDINRLAALCAWSGLKADDYI